MALAGYIPYTIDHTKVGAGTHTNFTLLVKKTANNLKTVAADAVNGKVQNANGYDIEFFSDAALTSKLDHWLVSYDGSAGTVIAWVRMPAGCLPNNSSDTTIYIGVGDATIVTNQSVATTFDSTYQMVFLMNSVADATGHVSITDSSTTNYASGKIANARAFNGSATWTITHNSYCDMTGAMTFSGWFNFASTGGGGWYTNGSDGQWGNNKTIEFGWVASDSNVYYLFHNGSNYPYATKNLTPTLGTWYYCVGTWDGTANANSIYVYTNGVAGTGVQSPITAAGTTSTNPIIGGTGGYMFTGRMENYRIASTCRSPGWILTEYNNQNAPDTFGTLGAYSAVGGAAPVFVPKIYMF